MTSKQILYRVNGDQLNVGTLVESGALVPVEPVGTLTVTEPNRHGYAITEFATDTGSYRCFLAKLDAGTYMIVPVESA